MPRMFRPKRPGYAAYFQPNPHEVEQARVRAMARAQQSRARIAADIDRHKVEMQQGKLGLTVTEDEDGYDPAAYCPQCGFLSSQCQCIDPVYAGGLNH